MSELVAVAFDNPQEADRVLTELTRLQKEYLVDLEDAFIAIRNPTAGSSEAKHQSGWRRVFSQNRQGHFGNSV